MHCSWYTRLHMGVLQRLRNGAPQHLHIDKGIRARCLRAAAVDGSETCNRSAAIVTSSIDTSASHYSLSSSSCVALVFSNKGQAHHLTRICSGSSRRLHAPAFQNTRACSERRCALRIRSCRCAPRLDLRVLSHSAEVLRAPTASSAADAASQMREQRAPS